MRSHKASGHQREEADVRAEVVNSHAGAEMIGKGALDLGLPGAKHSGKSACNRGPAEVRQVSGAAACGKFGAVDRIGEQPHESSLELAGLIRRDEDDTGIREGLGSLRARKGNNG